MLPMAFSGWWDNMRYSSPYFFVIPKFSILNMCCVYNKNIILRKR